MSLALNKQLQDKLKTFKSKKRRKTDSENEWIVIEKERISKTAAKFLKTQAGKMCSLYNTSQVAATGTATTSTTQLEAYVLDDTLAAMIELVFEISENRGNSKVTSDTSNIQD